MNSQPWGPPSPPMSTGRGGGPKGKRCPLAARHPPNSTCSRLHGARRSLRRWPGRLRPRSGVHVRGQQPSPGPAMAQRLVFEEMATDCLYGVVTPTSGRRFHALGLTAPQAVTRGDTEARRGWPGTRHRHRQEARAHIQRHPTSRSLPAVAQPPAPVNRRHGPPPLPAATPRGRAPRTSVTGPLSPRSCSKPLSTP